MFFKLLISYALFVLAAEARYVQYVSPTTGYVAHVQPAVSVELLNNNYGYSVSVPAYGAAYSYDVDGVGSVLGKLALTLPLAGHPNSVALRIPPHPSTSYSAPAVAVVSGEHDASGLPVLVQSAAVAASNVRAAGYGYGPHQLAIGSTY